MFIDMHVHPAFYEPINQDSELEELRHNTLDIHKNGTAPLEHIFNQMKAQFFRSGHSAILRLIL